jgi:hypothetical protein
MKKLLWTIFACTLVSTSSYIMNMEQNITTSRTIPIILTEEQINLTEELYCPYLDTKKLEELHQKGAQLNYTPQGRSFEPLYHWTLEFKEKMPYPRTSGHFSLYRNCYNPTKFYLHDSTSSNTSDSLRSLKIITKLLELGAQPTDYFSKNYFILLDYCMLQHHDSELKTLLKRKPTKICEEQLHNIWKYTITKETHRYVDFLVQYFTPDELESGLNYCTRHHEDILKGFHYSYEDYETYLPGITQKLIDNGANSHNYYLPNILAGTIINSFAQKNSLKQLKLLCDSGAFTERAIDILEEHLKDIEDEKTLCLSIIDTMKKNKKGNL